MDRKSLDLREVRPATISHYIAFFYHLNPSGQPLAGERARDFFLRSGLSTSDLGKIWRLADIDSDGRLNSAEFSVAMHLVRLILEGIPLPPTLPPILEDCVRALLSCSLPAIEDDHVVKCQTAFTAFKVSIATGTLGMEATKYLFSKTNLSQGQLFQIWKLSDQDGDGRLVFLEFVLAMHLVFLAKLGRHYFPLTIDPATLLPPLFYEIMADAQAGLNETPPTLKPNITTSDLFPPPNVPMEDAPNVGFNVSFTPNIMNSLSLQDEEDGCLYVPNPFTAPPSHHANGGITDRKDYVSNGSEEGVVMATDRVHEVAVMEEQPKVVLEAAHFTSIMSPPSEHLMMAEQVVIAQDLAVVTNDSMAEGGSEGEGVRVVGEVKEEEEWVDSVVEEQLIVESEDEEEEAEEGQERENQVHAEIESLTLESRQFLKESRSRLWEQQRRNLEPRHPSNTLGIDEYRRASLKGLAATIAEMEGSQECPETERNGDREHLLVDVTYQEGEKGISEEEGEEGDGEGRDILSRFDDIEAEIENALDIVHSEVWETVEEEREEEGEREREGEKEYVTTMMSKPSSDTRLLEEGVAFKISDVKFKKGVDLDSPEAMENVTPPPRRKDSRREEAVQSVMMDLDSYLQSEIDDLNDMFQEFETQDEKHKKRSKDEEEKIMTKEVKEVVIEGPKVSGIEEVTERRLREGAEAERLYQLEMRRLEQERLAVLEEESVVKKMTLESDQTIQNLDKEWENLLSKEEEHVKEAQKGKVALHKREEEERQRREQERREKAAEQEMTVEEWIAWMEDKKKQGMTSEQQIEYEKRKRAWLEREKERGEKKRRVEAEQIRKTRDRMAKDYLEFQERDNEVKANRLSSSELQQLHEEVAHKKEGERRLREEKTRRNEYRPKQLEEVKPKPKSALAAKWEEKVRSQHNGK